MSRFLPLAFAIAFFANALAAIAAPGLKEHKGDLKKLQGDWEVVSWIQLGQELSLKATWSFKDDKYTLDQGNNLEEGAIKLDAGKKPATIDLEITGGNCKGKDQPGIYKFDGDTVILCFAWPGVAERPTDFESTAENRTILIKLKRPPKE